MLEFLKKIFHKKSEKQDIVLEELPEWFNQKTKHIPDELNLSLKEDFDELRVLIEEFRKNISVLEEAEIEEEDKIQNKVKQVVRGHRANYTKTLRHLADSIEIPAGINHKSAGQLSIQIQKNLDELGKSTIKSYYAVQHLFHKELESVTKDLQQIDKIAKTINDKIDKSKIIIIDETAAKINLLIDLIVKKKDLNLQLKEKTALLSSLEIAKHDLENRISDLKKSNDFQSFYNLKQDIDNIDKSIKNKEDEIIQLFSPLESGLRKFKRISLEDEILIGSYSDSSVEALLKEDKDYRIISVLQNMKRSLSSDGMGLKEQKKKKILDVIGSITLDKLKNIVIGHKDLCQQRSVMETQLRSNPIKSRINEIDYKLESNKFKTSKIEEELTTIKKRIDQIDIPSMVNELQEKIKRSVDVEVSISL